MYLRLIRYFSFSVHYDENVKNHHGKFAKLNFIDDGIDDLTKNISEIKLDI